MAKYTPHTSADIAEMLSTIGVNSVRDLFDIPSGCAADLKLPEGKSELEVWRSMRALSEKNFVFKSCFTGAGAYNHYIPPVVTHLAAREEFVTAYTPYQAEMSQGILQSIFEYQSMIAALTGMDASNASHYDGATATADGILMCLGAKKKALVSSCINPDVLAVVKTYCGPYGVEIVTVPECDGRTDISALKKLLGDDVGAICIQQPNFFGQIEDVEGISVAAKAAGAKLVVNCYPISLGLLKAPAEYGADVACGEGQPLGMPLSFGGPYLGFLTCKEAMMRKLTGRIVGQTVDHDGRSAYVLTLQAREQHIRREKSSSSICSNEALCALTAAIYMAAMGKEGIKEVAEQCVSKAHYLAEKIISIPGFELKHKGEFFNEFVVTSRIGTAKIADALKKRGILSGYQLNDNDMLWCATEMNTVEDIDETVNILAEVAK
jgi:Glycine cleavage system protein P (pyridoxal-binding), N-terminal domain